MELMQSSDRGPVRRYDLDDGREVQLPTHIKKQQTMLAYFQAPTAAIRKVLPSSKLRVTELYPGRTLVGIACMEYDDLDVIEPYREVGVMIPVRYKPRLSVPALPIMAPQLFRSAGNYFHRMPVTNRDAFDLGVTMHGLRKVLADIRFEEDTAFRRCTVRVDDQLLLELEVRKGKPARPMTMTTQTYTLQQGKLLRTPVPTRGAFAMTMGPKSARLTLGDHALAQELRDLKLASAPMMAMYGPQLESLLCAPSAELPA